MIVWRRPNEEDIVSVKDYRPCPHCLAFVTVSEMWRHVKVCILKNETGNSQSLQDRSEMLFYSNFYSKGASSELQAFVLSNMIHDDVTDAVSGDTLITTMGSFLLSSQGHKKGNYIAQRMRLIARLLIILKSKHGSKEMIDFLDPQYFDDIVQGTRELGGYSLTDRNGEKRPSFSKPSLPLKMGYAIDMCCEILKGIAIKRGDEVLRQKVENLLQLYSMEWKYKISSISVKCLDDNKFDKTQLLPTTGDLLIVRAYLKTEIPIATQALVTLPTTDNWRRLAELVGIRLTMLNRRRISEVFGMLVTKFKSRESNKECEMDEIKKSLTPLEARLLDRLEFIFNFNFSPENFVAQLFCIVDTFKYLGMRERLMIFVD